MNRPSGDKLLPFLLAGILGFGLIAGEPAMRPDGAIAQSRESASEKAWHSLVAQARALGLPSRFLQAMAPEFLTIEFADLHSYAAEYDPDTHRMRLNRSFSFNTAGSVLRPLASLARTDVGTLYHELFHAYMDYHESHPEAQDSAAKKFLEFAREQQHCRYKQVAITPIAQRRGVTEHRDLTDRESWEALNETWAAFVGWAVWTLLEVNQGHPHRGRPGFGEESWLQRLKQADRDGLLTGYYEPESPEERAITRKRLLAPSSRISPAEVAILLEFFFEQPVKFSSQAARVMAGNPLPLDGGQCLRS